MAVYKSKRHTEFSELTKNLSENFGIFKRASVANVFRDKPTHESTDGIACSLLCSKLITQNMTFGPVNFARDN